MAPQDAGPGAVSEFGNTNFAFANKAYSSDRLLDPASFDEGREHFYPGEASSFTSPPSCGPVVSSQMPPMPHWPNPSSLASSSTSAFSSATPSSSTSQQSLPYTPVKSECTDYSSSAEDTKPSPSPEKLRWGVDYAPKVPLKNYVIRPAPPIIPDFVDTTNGSPHPLPRFLWVHVFRHLSQQDLVRLSCVCKTFDCWALDPALWPEINLSLHSVKQTHLKFSMLRQPRSLKLASSVISYAQLSWLMARLPGLRHLDLSNLSWASICALCSPNCPLLRSLNLSWATGIRDLCFRELASPPVNLKPGQRNISRLCHLERLSLTGTDINDQSLEVIAAHLPKLAALDLTCCMRVTDRGIRALVQQGGTPCLLREIRLVKCVQLTERCLEALGSCKELSFLALTDIPAIGQEACVKFSRGYRHRSLRARSRGIISK